MSRILGSEAYPLPDWLDGSGPAADLVLGTRALVVRNLEGVKFPGAADAAELAAVAEEVQGVAREHEQFRDWEELRLSRLNEGQRNSLVEKLFVSPRVVREPGETLLLGSPRLDRAVCVNASDHLRFAGFSSGFDPEGAAAKVLALEEALESQLRFAYQESLGYLTSEPTRLGTGLVFTAYLHLPGLVMADQIDKIVNALQQLRFNISGLRGAGASVRGSLFRISSQVTLGRDEQEIQDDFSFHLGKVILHEKSARQQLYEGDGLAIEDAVRRSHATLRAARLITGQECFDRLSHLRMGLEMGLLPDLTVAQLNRMLLWQQGAHQGLIHQESLSPREIQARRASFLREILGSE